VDEIRENQVIARSAADAPEIDGVVYLANTGNIKTGEFVEVEITGSDTHDLQARIVTALMLPAKIEADDFPGI